MTAAEMKSQFLVEYDAATSLSAPGWEDSEISAFLNKAQIDIVDELYQKRDFITMSNTVVTLDMSLNGSYPAITNAVYSIVDSSFMDGWIYLYYVSSSTRLTRTEPVITNEYIPNEVIDRLSAPKFYKTGMNKVWFKHPKCFFEHSNAYDSDVFVILYDAYTTQPTLCNFIFVAKPQDIDITTAAPTNLNESLHKNIVTKAVEEAVKSIKIAKIANQ